MTTLSVYAADFQPGDVIRLSEYNTVMVTGPMIRETAKQVTWPIKSLSGHQTPSLTKRKDTAMAVQRGVDVVTPAPMQPWDSCSECGDFYAWCPKHPELHHHR